MKRRSFFQRVIGGFAAACGMKLTPYTIYLQPYQGHKIMLWDVLGQRWIADALTVDPTAPPNVPMKFDPKAFERAMAPLNGTYANVFNRMEVVYGKAYFTHNGVEYVADLDKGVTADY